MSAWLLMPLLAAVVGGVTNWVAVELTLHPARPIGWGRWSFQGLLPRKGAHLVARFTARLLPTEQHMRELLAALDSGRVAEDLISRLGERADTLLGAVLSSVNPVLWAQLRAPVRQQWIDRLRPTLPRLISGLLDGLSEHPSRYLDIPAIAAAQVSEQPEILSDVLWRTGRAEFRFIEWSGAVVGAAMGLAFVAFGPQAPSVLVLAVFEAIVGGFTNWLAVRMLFAPVRPLRFGPWRLQGLVLRRQAEVSVLIAEQAMGRIVNFGRLLRQLSGQPAFQQLCRQLIARELELASGGAASLVAMALGGESPEKAVEAMAQGMQRAAPDILGGLTLDESSVASLHLALGRQLQAMSPEHYRELMYFMVAEDEPLLIVAGVVLAAAAGAVVGVLL